MDVTKPYEYIGFGAMDVTKSCEFIRFGAMDVTKPYEYIGFGAMDVTKPYEFIGCGGFYFANTGIIGCNTIWTGHGRRVAGSANRRQ